MKYGAGLLAAWVFFTQGATAAEAHDLVIYGGTPAAVSAAIQAARMGKTAIIIEPSKNIGGLTTAGLGATDTGNKTVIGGISREFYQRLRKHYDNPSSWKFEKQSANKSYQGGGDAIWTFEPAVAEKIFTDWLKEYKIPVVFGERLNRKPGQGVKKQGGRISAIVMESGQEYPGKMFLDTTYEGDLLAAAGVSYHLGREANATYKETLNGIEKRLNKSHQFIVPVDPYKIKGDPKSGLLPGIEAGPHPEDGAADHRLQAYCYRMCMSNVEANRIPFPKPDGYDESAHELLLRNFEAGDLRLPLSIHMMPNGKTDTNNNFAVSTDYIGANYLYPEASYEEREKILKEHEVYQKGLMWTMANHPRVPQKIRDQMKVWGLPKDEFVNNGGWPHQIYVREGRRMISSYVVTELDCRRLRDTPASVGMGSYNMDSHNCMRFVSPEGKVKNEGDIQVSPGGPYKISYLSLAPKKDQGENLLVPVCLSCSHMAYGSIRMEPVFMVLGQSAATAACMSIDSGKAVQDLPYELLRERLLKDKQVVEYQGAPPTEPGLDPKKMPGVVVDDVQAKKTGDWPHSSSTSGFVGEGYLHDGATDKGKKTVAFEANLDSGNYEVRLYYTQNGNRATKVPVTIQFADGEKKAVVNQRVSPPRGVKYVSLGTFAFAKGKPAVVVISNAGTDGHVIADAVQFLPVMK
ncbi:MAG: FAD-dependent oxidoreductase [Gemmataceae bacterium]|nr:FAD-dependent oxidoreductase [Gemmataceae bacterium]